MAMDKKLKTLIPTILTTLGVILLLAMAFNIFPGNGNILIFAALVCFIVAAVVKGLAKKL